MTYEKNRQPITNFEDLLQDQVKRTQREGRRPRITKASDILGPSIAPYAVEIMDMDSDAAAFNAFIRVPRDAVNSPDPTRAWIGSVVASREQGGVQRLVTYEADDAPHQEWIRTFNYVPGSIVRIYGDWARVGGSPAPLGRWTLGGFNVPSGSYVDLPFTTGGNLPPYYQLASGVVNIQQAGVYRINLAVAFSSNSSGARAIRIVRDPSSSLVSLSAVQTSWSLVGQVYLNTEYVLAFPSGTAAIGAQVYQNTGGSLSINSADDVTYLTIVREGDVF